MVPARPAPQRAVRGAAHRPAELHLREPARARAGPGWRRRRTGRSAPAPRRFAGLAHVPGLRRSARRAVRGCRRRAAQPGLPGGADDRHDAGRRQRHAQRPRARRGPAPPTRRRALGRGRGGRAERRPAVRADPHRAGRRGLHPVLPRARPAGRRACRCCTCNVDAYLRFVHARYGFRAGPDVFSQTFDLTFDLAMFDLFARLGRGRRRGVRPATRARLAGPLPDRAGRDRVVLRPQRHRLRARHGRAQPRHDAEAALEPVLRRAAALSRDAAVWQEAAPGSRVENLYGPTER